MIPTTTATTAAAAHQKLKTFGLPKEKILIGILCLFCFALVMIAVAAVLHRRQTKSDWLSAGLYGAVGRMGGGKSYLLVMVAYLARLAGRRVLSNFAVEGSLRYSSWAELLAIVKDGDVVLMDEVQLYWDSQAWRAPAAVKAFCAQLRHHGITMFWASQHQDHVSKRLRQLTFGIWSCTRYRRGHRYKLYDGPDFGKAKSKPLARMNVIRKPEVMAMYDTLQDVAPSMEWGDGAGLEDLSLRKNAGDAPSSGAAALSRRPGGVRSGHGSHEGNGRRPVGVSTQSDEDFFQP